MAVHYCLSGAHGGRVCQYPDAGGLKFGIDFKGGTLMTVKFAQQPPLEKIRSAFARSGKIKAK
jgi:preprotein translocase subunit SecF